MKKIVYLIIQIVFLPLTLIASIILNYKAIILSKKLGVDYTAEKVLQLRCKMHLLGIRNDEDSINMYKSLPIASYLSLQLLILPALTASRLFGFIPRSMKIPDKNEASIFQYIYVRTFEFDRILQKNINEMEQIVVLGAGYDLRALKYAKEREVQVFELDQKPIQRLKVKCLDKIGLQQNSIRYIPVDFNVDSWANKLLENGFDKSKKTFFLWEGVASYLDENVVTNTLQRIKSLAAKDSIVSFDYNSTNYNELKGPFFERLIVWIMKLSGKVFLFSIDISGDAKQNAIDFLKKCDLEVKDLTLIGKNNKLNSPFSGLIEATT